MSTSIWTELLVIFVGLIGVFVQCALKCQSLLEDARVANLDFKWKKDYLQRDAIPISLSFASVLLWYLLFGEVARKYPTLLEWRLSSFALCGAVGSYVIQYAIGKSKKFIRTIIDRKTDIADGKTKKDEQ